MSKSFDPPRAPLTRHALLILPALLMGCSGQAGEPLPMPDPIGARIESHVRELASERYEGRAPGSRGGEMAAAYVESRLVELGLRPAGTDGFRQPVPLLGVRTLASTRFSRIQPGDAGPTGEGWIPLPRDLYIAGWNRAIETSRIEGEAVFVGHGLEYDDRAGDDRAGDDRAGDDRAKVDLRNKWAVALAGDLPGTARSLSSAAGQPIAKLYAAARRGATGLILLSDAPEWPEPYGLAREQRILPDWGRANEGQPLPWIAIRGELVDDLSAGRNLWEEALAPGFRPRKLAGRFRLELKQEVRRFESPNLLARLPGGDSGLASRYVCLSAHYDGLGRSDDSVYHGVIDNAVAVGELLEAARLARQGAPPQRSLLFFFPTAEEAGLLGSRYFVEHPTVPLEDIVACLNKDGAPEAWGRSSDVIAIAAEASPPFSDALRSGVERLGFAWSPNPFPAEGFFFRSDHYSFLQAGVPAVLLFPGLAFEGRPAGWGVEQAALYLKEHYHRSTDDLSRVLDWEGPAQYTRFWLAMARELGDGEEQAWGEIDLVPER